MDDASFLRNEVLVDADGTCHRLLACDVEADDAWLIVLGDKLALPYWHRYSALSQTYGRLETAADRPEPPKSLVQPTKIKALPRPPSAASIALSERAMRAVEPLVDDVRIFDPHERNTMLLARSTEPGDFGTPKTLLKYLRAFWQGGQTQDALLGALQNCGRPDVVGTGNRGRDNKDGSKPHQLSDNDFKFMRDVLETFYFDPRKKRKLTDTLQELHERHYTYLDGNKKSYLQPPGQCPTYRQLEHFLKTKYPLEERLRRRKGDKRFAQEDRSTQGSVQLDCHGVGHIYEFDATIVDVLLTSSADKVAIVGKPTLYLIIDRASRLIVGWYLGFENASYSAAMQAIASIGEDKRALCTELGIPYDPADWPAHGVLPEMFIADQGELTSKKARRIARSLRCMLTNVPGLRPDWKPLVECGFAMLHQIIGPHSPGYSPDAENRRRRGPKPEKDASMNLHEFTSVMVKAIMAHNKTMQTGYPLTISQVADGVPPVPRELWAQGVRRRMGKLDRMDFERVRAELMPRGTATVTGDGLLFEGMYYSCPEAEAKGWLVAGRRSRRPFDIAFDYRLVDEVVVFAANGSGESYVASLTKDSVMFRGMSQADVKRHFYDVALLLAPAKENKRDNRYEFNQHVKATAKKATSEMKHATHGVSRSARKKDTAAARAAELAAERARTAGVVPPQAPASSAVTTPTRDAVPAVAPVVALVRPSTPPASTPVPAAMPATDRPLGLKERLALARKQMEG
jgi:putative transposase